MKCPHCNQEHPNDTKFCPATGKLMPQLLSCQNEKCINYGVPILPLDSRFCPECGEPVSIDIRYKGIVLGQTAINDLPSNMDWNIKKGDNNWVWGELSDEAQFVIAFSVTNEFYRVTWEGRVSYLSDDFFVNKRKVVQELTFYSYHLLPDIAVPNDCSDDELKRIIEDHNYMRIKTKNEDDFLFVRKKKDSKGNYIFLQIFSHCAAYSHNQVAVYSTNILTRWESYKTGKIYYSSDDSVDDDEQDYDPPQEDGVDLGLTVRWASCNLGAKSETDFGGLYGWADPTGLHTESMQDTLNFLERWKSSADHLYGGCKPPLSISRTKFDIASVKLGSVWRIPTRGELDELYLHCKWDWTQINGVNGFKVTGPNGNSIFLPAAGKRDGTYISGKNSVGNYWSANLCTDEGHGCDAFYLSFSKPKKVFRLAIPSIFPHEHNSRYMGFSIRPVLDIN